MLAFSHNCQLFLRETIENRKNQGNDAENSALCTGARSNLGDRVLGEVEKNSFSALPSKGGHSWPMPSKLCVPTQGGFGEEFYSNGSRVRFLIRSSVCAGPAFI